MRKLREKVCVVTGASRGVGRGIAIALGEQGAIVYVTGRSVRGGPSYTDAIGTIEDTADEVTRRGGLGIAVACDHTDDQQTKAVFERVKNEHGRLDVLVNNAWGGYERYQLMPSFFWKTDLALWDRMFTRGVRAQLVSSYFGIPLMLPRKRGLIVNTVAWDHDKYIGSFYDLAKHASVRMMWGLAQELRDHKIATIALAPGFTRSERVLAAFKVDEQHWQDIPGLAQTESPEYAGRAVVALATDREIMKRSGKAFRSGELARQYGFRDVDGRYVPPFTMKQSFVEMVKRFAKRSS